MLYVNFSMIMCLIGYQSPYLLIQLGWLTSWVFSPLQSRLNSQSMCSTPVSLLSNVVYKICTRLGVVKAYGADNYDPLPTNGNFSSLPGGARAEAERRRLVSSALYDRVLICNLLKQGHGSQSFRPACSLCLSSYHGTKNKS